MWRKRTLIFVVVFCMVGLCSCSFFRPRPAKLYKRAMKEQPFDVIIVPGVPFDGKEWSMAMKGRVIWASHLVKRGVAKNIIFSGAAVYTPYVEARVMSLYAQALGVPKENIFTEEQAEHSTENVYYSYLMAKKLGFKKIAVASDPFQSKLLMGFTKRRFDEPIAHIPFIIDTLKTIDDVSPKIVSDSAMKQSFKPITETQSKWYRFKGTIGRNIRFEKD